MIATGTKGVEMRRPKGIARLSVFALLGVGTIAGIVLLCSIFVEQVYVRRGLREVRARVDPVSFRLVESASAMSVNRDDLFLFALDGQDIRAARRYFSPCCFGVYTLKEFSVGTNRIFLTLGKSCKRQKIANALNDIARLRNNKIYVVGCASDETKCMVCEEWKGSWEKMRFNGSKLDCSVVDSLFYISPLVCHPLLGRLAGKFGTVKSRRASWYHVGGTPFVDTFPMVPIEDLAVSEVCDTAEKFETRHGALIAITNRRDLCERNMTRLVGCLAETNDLLSAEQIVALKIGIVDLLQRQKPMPETIVDALIDVVFF